MLLQLSQLYTTLQQGEQAAPAQALRQLGLAAGQVQSLQLIKSSVDARRQPVRFAATVLLGVDDATGARLLAQGSPNLRAYEPPAPMRVIHGQTPLPHRPIVVGLGPAGLFAALLLAREGYRPLVLERGAALAQRVTAVERYWREGVLDPQSNVQFGEGGAGAFSDGKLTTRIHDPLCVEVLQELVRHGAPEDILYKAKPHVGTDLLRGVVTALRQEILRLGGEVRFLAPAEEFVVRDGALRGIACAGDVLPATAAIVAVGHSARDTFAALQRCGAAMTAKPFSVGARIEHLQADIDRALYGAQAGHPNLPAGEYQLSHREGNRAAYTFCMCPGGMVVAAASAEGQTVTNGMSYRARDLKNANSALVVSVDAADCGESWQSAVAFQQRLEQAAFSAGGGRAPCMRVGALLQSRETYGFGRPEPSYPPGVTECDLAALLPPQVTAQMRRSLPVLGRRLRGFDSANAVLTGVETRTSSPVRVLRDEQGQSRTVAGLYPCGEGAGYAGGIMSAAVDGLRCALLLMQRYAPPKN